MTLAIGEATQRTGMRTCDDEEHRPGAAASRKSPRPDPPGPFGISPGTDPRPDAEHDAADVRAALAGDATAFRRLVERYASRILAVVGQLISDRGEAEDVTQEVFFKVYRKLGSFRQESSFYTWLYRVAINAATDRRKRRRRDTLHCGDEAARLAVSETTAPSDDPLGREELAREVRAAVADLPDKYRTILLLREFDGLAYEDIAAALGCSLGTVESRLFRARARLREKIARRLRT